MDVTVSTQPLTSSTTAAAFITGLATDDAITKIDIVVAWVKGSGLRQVGRALEAFTHRGGSLRIVTGISQGGATRQGLSGIAGLTNDAFVFHQPTRTFHPKLYLGTGPAAGRFLVGSQNLTKGGLSSNFEVGVIGTADLDSEADQKVLSELSGYMDMLIADGKACHRLTPVTLQTLLDDPHYLVGDEAKSVPPVAGVPKFGEAWTSIFGSSALDLQSAAGAQIGTKSKAGPALVDSAAAIPSTTHAAVVRRWYKQLPASNVSRVGGNTNPQGHLTLSRGPGIKGHPLHPIKQGEYFRQIFFGDAVWGPGKTDASEVATVTVQVIAAGVDLGVFSLEVEHRPSFESGQGNRSSFLHWGPKLSEYLRKQVDHTGDVATLEKLDDGSYKLIMDQSATGPFL